MTINEFINNWQNMDIWTVFIYLFVGVTLVKLLIDAFRS
jgi:hypothetical protein